MMHSGERIAIPGWLIDPSVDNFVLRVVGDAMIEEGIFDGDLVIVRHYFLPAAGEVVIALVGDDAILRRFYMEGDDTALLEAANPSMQTIRLPLADLKIQGVAVGLIRQFHRKEART